MPHLTLPDLAFSLSPAFFLVISHLSLTYSATLVNNGPGCRVLHTLSPSQITPFPFVISQLTQTEASKFCSQHSLLQGGFPQNSTPGHLHFSQFLRISCIPCNGTHLGNLPHQIRQKQTEWRLKVETKSCSSFLSQNMPRYQAQNTQHKISEQINEWSNRFGWPLTSPPGLILYFF